MRNHDQKNRDMARSILPSKARRRARFQKKATARRIRRRNNIRLLRLVRSVSSPADVDDFEEPLSQYRADVRSFEWGQTGDVLIDRRNADKVAPIMRWAEVHVTNQPNLRNAEPGARRAHFATILGQTKAGRHALSHLEDVIGLENPTEYGFLSANLLQAREEAAAALAEARRARAGRSRQLAEVLAGADARRLNARIRALTPPVEERWGVEWDGDRIRRVLVGRCGFEPWLYTGCEAWIEGEGPRLRGVGRVTERQEIAFTALEQVHAEMFGWTRPGTNGRGLV